MAAVSPFNAAALMRQVCERFMDEAGELLGALPERVDTALETPGAKKTVLGKFEVMEAQALLRQKSGAWLKAARRAWRGKAHEHPAGKPELSRSGAEGLALVGDDEVDRAVAVGHLAAAIRDRAGQQLNDLRARLQHLEENAASARDNVFQPETFAQALLDAWADCGFTSAQWKLVREALHQHAAQGLYEAYRHANAFLDEHGVTAKIDLRTRVRRAPDRAATLPGRLPGMSGTALSVPDTLPGFSLYPGISGGGGGPSGLGTIPGGAGRFAYAPPGSAARTQYEAMLYGGGPGAAAGAPVVAAGPGAMGMAAGTAVPAGGGASSWGAPMALAVAPFGIWQQQRAQGVLADLRQFAQKHGVPLTVSGLAQPVSPVLALALAEPAAEPVREKCYQPGQMHEQADAFAPTVVDDAVEHLKNKAQALKDKTKRPDEKAVIEIVSLMFQAILTDERLPLALRVWFGRLQVPVLRVALAEPEFFAAPDHPARQLIDRMGACAMGLDNTEVDGGRLEQEVRRIVQMIEQYPETGEKVFRVALGEFEKFLGSALVEGESAQKFTTLAQQIEQKDALAIRYTIELRDMLKAVPVSEEVRQFLFRVWAEVLALAAVRRGAQDAETMRFKQAAVDLLWAVSPKTERAERQQVTQYLSGILQTLRAGMQTLAMQAGEQDGHIHLINQAVAQAFHAPEQGITPAQMNQLARALTGLEDVVTDDPEGDLLLDPALLEQILGVDGKDLVVIASGGARPDAGRLQWARGLPPGQWFTLQYRDAPVPVQYVWRSARGQLHLFATAAGQSYLIQTRRLASYLQAGLMVPMEDEALTTRATREALAKLGQEPERLLS